MSSFELGYEVSEPQFIKKYDNDDDDDGDDASNYCCCDAESGPFIITHTHNKRRSSQPRLERGPAEQN